MTHNPENSPRYVVKTLGCKANLYDSQQIERELQKHGWVPATDDALAELCIVNSCTVTDEADRQSRKAAFRFSQDHPHAKIVFTGCSAEVEPGKQGNRSGIHYVVGNQDKPRMVNLILEAIEKDLNDTNHPQLLGAVHGYGELRSRHPMDREWPTPETSFSLPLIEHGESTRTRVFLKIQEGCDSFCTYCIIPYGRGPNRSLRIRDVVEQVRQCVDQGIREVVITGTNIGEYGVDWGMGPALEDLLGEILNSTRRERLRVSSLDPVEITPGMIQLMEKNPRFCPHFHVSLQSPHSRILKLMKRKYRAEDVEVCLKRIAQLKAPPGGVFVGVDIITGFPGETEEDFQWGVSQLEMLPWSRLHVFPYSEREGTPATRLPGAVPQSERVRRAKILRELSLNRLKKSYFTVLEEFQKRKMDSLDGVLLEGLTRGPDATTQQRWMSGYTRNYFRVIVPVSSPEKLTNQVVSVLPESLWVDSQGGEVTWIGRLISDP